MPTESGYHGRVTEDYIISQIEGFRTNENYLDHKRRIREFDQLYRGDLNGLFPEESAMPDDPLVENKVKNATHDLARLASEAKGAHVFLKDGEGMQATKRAAVRSSIADTIWQMGGGKRIQRKLYMDLITAGMATVAVYYNEDSDYPIFNRLDPRFCYPDERNGQLTSMFYVETMKERIAAMVWPDLGLDPEAKGDEVHISQYFDKYEVIQCVSTQAKRNTPSKGYIVDRWEHNLGCIPVAWISLDNADGHWGGLFDQLGGPLMVRNKIVRLLVDYLESMAHATLEAKGVINADEEPGPLTVYRHDETAPESFIRRVAPAAPAGSVFGLLQYMNSEEAAEAIQPPARVGVVRQSIASGSFVDSTQGTLSSAIFELQELMADLRYQINYIAFKVDRKYLNRSKPLYRAIGTKSTYMPEKDMGDFYHHTIQYGASAGLNRSEAGVRVLQDMGAGLISKEMARSQLDYIEDVTVEQNRIDKEQLANVFFQRFSSDPNTPLSLIATSIIEMAKGRTFLEIVEDLAPEIIRYEQEQQQAAAAAEGVTPPEEGVPAPEEQLALEQGAIPELDFAPPPLQQQIVRNPF